MTFSLLRCLHIFMLLLCLLASFTIFYTDNYLYKIILCVLLICYGTFFACSDAVIIVLDFFREGNHIEITDIIRYSKLHKLRSEQSSSSNPTLKKQPIESHTKSLQIMQNISNNQNINNTQNDSYLNHHSSESSDNLNRSRYDESMSMHDLSLEMKRSLSRSYIEQESIEESGNSRIIRRESRERGEIRKNVEVGKGLEELFRNRSSKSIKNSLQFDNLEEECERPLTITYRMAYNHVQEGNYKTLYMKYQQQLRIMGIEELYVSKVIVRIRRYLLRYLQKLLEEELRFKEQIIDLVEEYFNLRVEEQLDRVRLSERFIIVENYSSMLEKLSLVNARRLPIFHTQWEQYPNTNLNTFLERMEKIMTEKRALDFELGCLVQGNMQSTQSFKKKLALRWEYLRIIDKYIEDNSKGEGLNEGMLENSKGYQEYVYILSVFVRHLNSLLDANSRRVKLLDGLGLSMIRETSVLVEEKYDYEIYLEMGYDNVMPHYDLKELENNKRYHCEPGKLNYLSVAAMYLLKIAEEKKVERSRRLAAAVGEMLERYDLW